MTSDPIRLLDDQASAAALRGDLGAATNVQLTGFNAAGGLEALRAAMGGEAAATAAVGSAGGLSGGAKFAIAGALLVGGAGLWAGIGAPTESPAEVTEVAETPEAAKVAVVARERTDMQTSVEAIEPLSAPVTADSIEAVAVETAEISAADDVVAKVRLKPRRKAAPLTAEDALAEAGLISRATRALAVSPSRALELTREAKRDFPRGMLGEEREAIAIQALAKLGHAEKARRRGERFLRRYGRGPYAVAVRGVLNTIP
ncbi:MAG: hypothetical protein JKY37_08385 [Nannocystaceae bacterium]|nr:hypothetical protein [Nannocystaceae bacterium]